MRLIDEQYRRTPYDGSRRMTAWRRRQGHEVNRKRVQRLMNQMGLAALYPRQRSQRNGLEHRLYPYLLGGMVIEQPNQVWSTDITSIPMHRGFRYLVAMLDGYRRSVSAWHLSNTLDTDCCLLALETALGQATPPLFNTDQGVQFTSRAFTERLERAEIAISRDGRGRALDNVFVERLWRTVKYEDIYLNDYDSVLALEQGLSRYFHFYNQERLHQRLDYRTPAAVHFAASHRSRH